MTGIVGYQTYLPKYRISSKEFRSVWGTGMAGVNEKTVPYSDEDSITMGLKAAQLLFENSGIDPRKVDSIYFASISAPYIDKPISTLFVSLLGLKNTVFTSDFSFSAQTGVMALINCLNYVQNNSNLGLVIISDCLKSKPGSTLEPSLACGAVALMIGKENPIADITGSFTYSSEISDRWRAVDQDYQTGDDRFTREFGFINAIKNGIQGLLKKTNKNVDDIAHFIVQQPDGRMPDFIAKELKIDKQKFQQGMIVTNFGDLGSASVFVGLSKVLENSKAGDEIVVASYSSGGCTAVSLKVNHSDFKSDPTIQYYIDNKILVNYIKYLQLTKSI